MAMAARVWRLVVRLRWLFWVLKFGYGGLGISRPGFGICDLHFWCEVMKGGRARCGCFDCARAGLVRSDAGWVGCSDGFGYNNFDWLMGEDEGKVFAGDLIAHG
ncbi:hypothetical protein M0R45_015874 [Rubus argutus]|uniref:Uncharacterized protein n=1 Tax=Rubus argutus TaxID=59490 RepID=A0AAW1XUL8_RUBAR